MAFPKKIFGIEIGWTDLGNVAIKYSVENGLTIETNESHLYCRARIRVGKENGDLFKFCPRCLVKIKRNDE